MRRLQLHPFLTPVLLLLLLLPATGQSREPDPELLLARHFQEKLDHRFPIIRTAGIVGLGHFETGESATRLAGIAREARGFERLLALWALARAAAPDFNDWLEGQAQDEWPRLLKGSFYEVAARMAFLASRGPDRSELRQLDRVLPQLYNAARNGKPEEKLLAAWALRAIGTGVTRATADAALAAARELDPGHAHYTRHLLFIRLLGPPAAKSLAPLLESLLLFHDFEPALVPKRALTAFTLAFITHPGEPPALATLREELRRDLDHPLRDFTALDAIRALGPFACTPGMVDALREKAAQETDENERELAAENLRMCGGIP